MKVHVCLSGVFEDLDALYDKAESIEIQMDEIEDKLDAIDFEDDDEGKTYEVLNKKLARLTSELDLINSKIDEAEDSVVESSSSDKKKLVNAIWKKLNSSDKIRPAKNKMTHAYREDIARIVGVEMYDKFSLLDLDEDKLKPLAAAFGLKL